MAEMRSLDEFARQIDVTGRPPTQQARPGSLNLDPSAQPPLDKFTALQDADKKFKATWERTRTDQKDRSPSGWDMALADIAVGAGWSDQEVADLIVANRAKHGDDLKLRQDYYAETIAKARVLHGNIEQLLLQAGDDPEKRKTLSLQYISEHLGVPVHGMIRHPGPPASYRLKTELGDMPIKSIDALTSSAKFRNIFADSTGKILPIVKPSLWQTIAQALLDICEDDLIEDATEIGRAADWLDGYLTKSRIYMNAEVGVPQRQPFISAAHDARIAFFGDGLHTWLLTKRMEKVSRSEMSALLRAVGCEQTKLNLQVDGKWTSRLVWLRPHPQDAEITGARHESR